MSAFTDGVAKQWFDQLSEDDRRLLETLSQDEWQHGVEQGPAGREDIAHRRRPAVVERVGVLDLRPLPG